MNLFAKTPRIIKYAKIKVDSYLASRLQSISGDLILCTVSVSPSGQFIVAVDGGDDGGGACWFSSIGKAVEVFEELKQQQPLTLEALTKHNFDLW